MNRLLLSVAAAALLVGTGVVNAQSPGAGAPSGAQPSATPPAAGAAPSGQRSGSDAAPPAGQKSGQMAPREGSGQRAQDAPGQKSNMSSDRQDRMDKGGAGEDKNRNADTKGADDRNRNADTKGGAGDDRNRNADSKSGPEGRSSATTGQAGAAGKLSGEQRTKITTVIKQQRVQPATNINFSISVGTRVPRDVRFYPLPTEIITIYPAWRGYEFFQVGNEIVVVDPRSMEIVAVLDA